MEYDPPRKKPQPINNEDQSRVKPTIQHKNLPHKRAGFVLESTNRVEFAYVLKYEFPVSNNESEYEELLAGFGMTLARNIEQLIIQRDSKVVFRQVTSSFEAKEENMKWYLQLAKRLTSQFKATRFEKIHRRQNRKVDDLSKAITG
ncbi:hypothetical protein M9H77_22451 [Catharanthus roseus]|uniref:Uncharacterized protein n=1 Tax=Catharanthus roseus TaxID=4058 RepID=A0ACC0AUK5_CATRO|nr:hypothetical protein M9H77_22451 [Catharanthus roseus]